MIELRSSLLRAFPRKTKLDRWRGFPLRALIFLGYLLLIATPVILIVNRSLQTNGVGRPLYWLHDYVFLPLKGYLFNLFFPWSLVGWGVLLTLLCLYAAARLCKISFIAEPHLYLARIAVSQERFQPVLVRISRQVRRLAGPSHFLDAVLNRYREEALIRLWASSEPDPTAIQNAFRFSKMQLQLLNPTDGDRQTRVRALAIYHRLVGRLLFFRGGEHKAVDPIPHDLFQEIAPAMSAQDARRETEADHPFSLTSLANDLCHLACLFDAKTRARVLPHIDRPEQIMRAVATRLATASEARISLITRLHGFFEQRALFPETIEGNEPPELGETAHEPEEAALLGSLALELALDASLLTANPEIALAYLDAVESLRLAMQLNDAFSPREEVWRRKTSQLFRDTPLPEHFRACAELAWTDLARRERIWRQSTLFGRHGGDGPIRKTDFDLEKMRVRSLFQAAGPGLDQDLSSPEPL